MSGKITSDDLFGAEQTHRGSDDAVRRSQLNQRPSFLSHRSGYMPQSPDFTLIIPLSDGLWKCYIFR